MALTSVTIDAVGHAAVVICEFPGFSPFIFDCDESN